MKTRTGFVSNSSSSSFIVAVKRNADKCPHCGRGGENFLDEVENASTYNSDNSVEARGMDAIILELANLLSDSTPEEKQEISEKLKKYDNPEWEIANVWISYYDRSLNAQFFEEKRNGNIVEILNEENI